MTEPTLKTILEAILFASDEPVPIEKLADAAGDDVNVDQAREALHELAADYDAGGRAFAVQEVAGGYQLFTRPEFSKYLKKLLRARSDAKFTQAALETLAIIAYKQPVTRATIEDIRGVAAGDLVRTLMEKGLVRVTGRSEQLGRALLYGTTKKFLQVFGLPSIKELPSDKQLLQP
jgi:segregation and condensation protein B